MYKYKLYPLAEKEFFNAIYYYENINKELGDAFFESFLETIAFICENPKMYIVRFQPNIRRALLNKFPYTILYRLHNDIIQVLAIGHQKRNPQYWEKRIQVLL